MTARRASPLALLLCAALLGACAGTGKQPLPGTSSTELKTASDATDTDKLASIRLELAIGYYQTGNYDVALDEVKKALAASPDLADAYGVRALIYTAMDEMVLADENYQRAMRLAPNNPELRNNYGSFLCQNGRYDQGLAQFQAALSNPRYHSPVKAMVNAGGCANLAKKFDLAERYFLEAQKLEPELPAIFSGLARVYFQRRDYQRAGFFINRLTQLSKLDTLSADVLWLAIRIERKLGNRPLETSLVTQLSRRFPNSAEFAAFQRGAYDE
ncbi:type IV pilus biogenesis/stability protein PilW [Massilia sp. PAMC28688]|uniref:type IV pilus biogenesis/stability protein PilW n=1 Tax=Massilia sp. PAMC28688 TaxID=2861283 RepID=UPI001C634A1E|nr:type IV pilus biogenesis/stability protein PilW [Massilia sp. PAMC28688]QYF92307.1 type IV pilus biogenesis/stability protein PilW [Massilia sp. PAMC28688]